jgi:hypothetical protein
MFSLSTFDLTRLITLSLVFAWFILGLYLSFTTHYTDPVLAGQREEQLVASIRGCFCPFSFLTLYANPSNTRY